MRDWLAHAYFGSDADILWDVVEHKVPELLALARPLLDAEASGEGLVGDSA